MQSVFSDEPIRPERGGLTVQMALWWAWMGWLVLLAIPFFFFMYMIGRVMIQGGAEAVGGAGGGGEGGEGMRWFVAMVVYHLLVVPGSVFLRSRLFRPYFRGERIAPRAYLGGMLIVWGALEVGGLLSIAGCLVTRSLMPNMLTAMVAFVIFVALWPTGQAMLGGHKGDSDDPERYEEPR